MTCLDLQHHSELWTNGCVRSEISLKWVIHIRNFHIFTNSFCNRSLLQAAKAAGTAAQNIGIISKMDGWFLFCFVWCTRNAGKWLHIAQILQNRKYLEWKLKHKMHSFCFVNRNSKIRWMGKIDRSFDDYNIDFSGLVPVSKGEGYDYNLRLFAFAFIVHTTRLIRINEWMNNEESRNRGIEEKCVMPRAQTMDHITTTQLAAAFAGNIYSHSLKSAYIIMSSSSAGIIIHPTWNLDCVSKKWGKNASTFLIRFE